MDDRHIIEDWDPEGCRARRELRSEFVMDPARVREQQAAALARAHALLRQELTTLQSVQTWLEGWASAEPYLSEVCASIAAIRDELAKGTK